MSRKAVVDSKYFSIQELFSIVPKRSPTFGIANFMVKTEVLVSYKRKKC